MIAAALHAFIAALRPTHEVFDAPDGFGKICVHEEGWTISAVPGPYRGQRHHRFDDVGSFALWLNRHATPELAEILVDDTIIRAGLAPQSDKTDLVLCDLTLHPTAQRWSDALTTPQLSQKQLYKLLLASVDDFEEHPKTKESWGRMLAEELQKLEIVKKGEYTSTLDARGFYSFVGGSEKTEVGGKLPREFEITIPWFRGVCWPKGSSTTAGELPICQYNLDVLLEMDTSNPTMPTFRLEAPGLELLKYEARDDAVSWLRHLLEGDFLVGLGTFKTERVPLLTGGAT